MTENMITLITTILICSSFVACIIIIVNGKSPAKIKADLFGKIIFEISLGYRYPLIRKTKKNNPNSILLNPKE